MITNSRDKVPLSGQDRWDVVIVDNGPFLFKFSFTGDIIAVSYCSDLRPWLIYPSVILDLRYLN